MVGSDDMIVPFNEKSLFTSIPKWFSKDSVKEIITKNHALELNGQMVEHIFQLRSLCLRKCIQFGGSIYEQTGRPIFLVMVALVLQKLDHLTMLDYRP